MTVLTQLSVGAFAAIWLLQLLGAPGRLTIAAIGSLTVGGLALGASTMHLGRPIHAYRALKMWKRSWLSREVLMFGLFSGMAGAYAGSLLLKLASSSALGGLTALLGAGGITASACIYLVRARPAWNSKHTIADFFLTASILGPLFAANISAGSGRLLALIAVAGASAQLLNNALRFLRLNASESFERQSTARLLSTVLASRFLLRGALLVAGGIALPLLSAAHLGLALALALALGGELLGRYLFYVSVVPKNIAASYIASGMEMAG
jgi:DMSO reductase anchor subunit